MQIIDYLFYLLVRQDRIDLSNLRSLLAVFKITSHTNLYDRVSSLLLNNDNNDEDSTFADFKCQGIFTRNTALSLQRHNNTRESNVNFY